MRRKYKPIIINGDGSATIPLTKGKVSVIDASDLSLVKDFNWCLHSNGYAYAWADRKQHKMLLMHRVILKTARGKIVDHIDRNRLNNRRKNLREVTYSENLHNSKKHRTNRSGITGVCFCNTRKKWFAYIKINYKHVFLGRFDTKANAVSARKAAEQKYFPKMYAIT